VFKDSVFYIIRSRWIDNQLKNGGEENDVEREEVERKNPVKKRTQGMSNEVKVKVAEKC